MSKFNIDDGDFTDDIHIEGNKNNDMNNDNNGNEVKEKDAAKK